MQHFSPFRRFLTAGAVLTVLPTFALSATATAAAAATQVAHAADLPSNSTPQVAFDPRATQPAKGVAARGADGALLYAARSGTGFAPFQSLGGIIVGDPSAVVTPEGTDLFARGTDDQVYTNRITPGGAITGYSTVPGLTVTGEVESVVPFGEPFGTVRIFARGPDGAVWTNVRRNGAWAGWSSLGGFITSEITASRQLFSARSVRIFVRGSDNRVYRNEVGPSDSAGFQPIGDLRVSGNVAVRDDHPFGGLDLLARGEDSRIYTIELVTGTPWRPMDGVAAAGDPAASTGFVYVRGSDNAIYTARRDSNAFERVEGQVTGNPAAFTLQQNGGPLTQYLLARQPNGALAFNIRLNTGATFGPFGGYIPIAGPAID